MRKPGVIPYQQIKIDKKMHKAAAPIVISASRATDIPAFYGNWFQKQLQKGYVKRINPFSGKPYYISLENAAAYVFWSKNPAPFIPFLEQFRQDFYIQYTLNNYDNTGLEPNVPYFRERLKTFIHLSETYGKARVLWRFDPLMLLPQMPVEDLLHRIDEAAKQLKGYTERMTISFLTLNPYRFARTKLINAFPDLANNVFAAVPNLKQQKQILKYLQNLQKEWQKVDPEFRIAACAVPENLSAYGIFPPRCIDDALLARLFPQNTPLMNFLGKYGLWNINTPLPDDKSQRKHCHCIPSKDIGAYNTCQHGCVYCYANKQIPG